MKPMNGWMDWFDVCAGMAKGSPSGQQHCDFANSYVRDVAMDEIVESGRWKWRGNEEEE